MVPAFEFANNHIGETIGIYSGKKNPDEKSYTSPIGIYEKLKRQSELLFMKNLKKMTMSEIFSSNTAMALSSEKFEKNEVILEENSPEEIRELVIEMDERLNGSWKETEEDVLCQKKFWSIFTENMKKLNLQKPIHGEIKAKFGSKFLSDNQNWIK